MGDQKKILMHSSMLGYEDSVFKNERLAIFTLIFLPKYTPFCLAAFTLSTAFYLFDLGLRLRHGLMSSPGKYDLVFMVERVGMILLEVQYIWGEYSWYMAVAFFAFSNMFYILRQKKKIFETAAMTFSLSPRIIGLLAVSVAIVYIVKPGTFWHKLVRDAKKGKEQSTNKEAEENNQGGGRGRGGRWVKEYSSMAKNSKSLLITENCFFWYERGAIFAVMFEIFDDSSALLFFIVDALTCLICSLKAKEIEPGPTDPSYLFWMERAAMILLASYITDDGSIYSLYSAATIFVFTNAVYTMKPLQQLLKITSRSTKLEKEEDKVTLDLRRLTSENEELKKQLIEADERWAENRSDYYEERLLEAEEESQALKNDKRKLEAEIEKLAAEAEENWTDKLERDRAEEEARIKSLEVELSEAKYESQALNEEKEKMEAEIKEQAEEIQALAAVIDGTRRAAEKHELTIDGLKDERISLIEKLNQYQQGDNSASSSSRDAIIQLHDQLMEELLHGDKFEAEIKHLKEEVHMLTSVSEHDQAALSSLERHSLDLLKERKELVAELQECRSWNEEWLEERDELLRRIAGMEQDEKKLKHEKEELSKEREELVEALAELDEQQTMWIEEKANLEAQLGDWQYWYDSNLSETIEYYTEASNRWTAEKNLLESEILHAKRDEDYYKTLLLEYQEDCSMLEESRKELAQKLKDKSDSAEICQNISDELSDLKAQLEEAMERSELYKSLLRNLNSCPKFA
ncbi:hypothetical protein PanWU01x14_360810 [Parasponia andersonii]|uniref:Uncharacterized protein n=1 Tax=Parasponia andersonii TaxID=3476 RepID=A0A2P5A7I0_PARAD|nr:hypothetical protein PanWU01x14_360810 [Parasponia andersonii]